MICPIFSSRKPYLGLCISCKRTLSRSCVVFLNSQVKCRTFQGFKKCFSICNQFQNFKGCLSTDSHTKYKTLNKCQHYLSTHSPNSRIKNLNVRDKSCFFITTPIFYVNASPHLGHLYTALLADATQRYQSLRNGHQILFSTGTDEHGLKVEQAAASSGVSPTELCNQVSEKYRNLFDQFSVNYTDYIRTSDGRHIEAVKSFCSLLQEKGHIYRAKYEGWYCIADETFLTELQVGQRKLSNGESIHVSLESGHRVEWNSEINYMFKLSSFQNDLLHWLKDESIVTPSRFHKQLVQDIERGLHDLSVSRPAQRVSWGIGMPGNEEHTIYVWLDALVNYLTVGGYSPGMNRFMEPQRRGNLSIPQTSSQRNLGKMVWPPDVQVIGKDILRFHGIYWPALLMAGGFDPPRQLLVHCHWQVDGEKMSKSKGNVLCPRSLIEKFSKDGVRYVLLRSSAPHSDSSWNDVKAERFLNSELADTLGNLLSRCIAPSLNPTSEIPFLHQSYVDSSPGSCKDLISSLEKLPCIVDKHFCNYNYHFGVDAVMSMLRLANAFIQDSKPWELKANPVRHDLDSILHLGLAAVNAAGICLQPIIPNLCNELFGILNIPQSQRMWSNIRLEKFNERSGQNVGHRKVLFQKIRS